MRRECSSTLLLFILALSTILLLVHFSSCDGYPFPAPASTKSVASSLLRNRGRSKPKSSSSSSSICLLPPVTPGAATCFASFRRWTYTAEKGKCEEIYYGGCFGTKNLFDSYDECRKACGGVAG